MYQATTLSAKQLSCTRGDRLLFKNISFELSGGELLLVEGQNGSGKSSLLKLIIGLTHPFAGKLLWQNQAIETVHAHYVEQLHYIGHQNGLKLGLTLKENLQLMGLLSSQATASFESLLILLQLEDCQHRLVKNLSAGQKRRVALAKLFLSAKPIWILDEPCTGLDSRTQETFLLKLEEHLQAKGLAILSTHHSIDVKKFKTHILRLAP